MQDLADYQEQPLDNAAQDSAPTDLVEEDTEDITTPAPPVPTPPTPVHGAMGPPPRLVQRPQQARAFDEDTSEALPNPHRAAPVSDTELGLAVWCTVSGTSRTQYKGLRQVLS